MIINLSEGGKGDFSMNQFLLSSAFINLSKGVFWQVKPRIFMIGFSSIESSWFASFIRFWAYTVFCIHSDTIFR